MMDEQLKVVDLSPGGWVTKYGRPRAGWGCVLGHQKTRKTISGSASSKSEFRMELLGLVNGLKQIKYPCIVVVHTATEYLLQCIGELLRPRCKYTFPKEVHSGRAKNADLWREFEALSEIHCIQTSWVPTRSKDPGSYAGRSSARHAALHGPTRESKPAITNSASMAPQLNSHAPCQPSSP
jgi:ribonuclease HI